jgi:hypothetical protein
MWGVVFPGRCPGLYYFRLLGDQFFHSLFILADPFFTPIVDREHLPRAWNTCDNENYFGGGPYGAQGLGKIASPSAGVAQGVAPGLLCAPFRRESVPVIATGSRHAS